MYTDKDIICFLSGYLCPIEPEEEDVGFFGGSLFPYPYMLGSISAVLGIGLVARWAYGAYNRYKRDQMIQAVLQAMDEQLLPGLNFEGWPDVEDDD